MSKAKLPIKTLRAWIIWGIVAVIISIYIYFGTGETWDKAVIFGAFVSIILMPLYMYLTGVFRKNQ